MPNEQKPIDQVKKPEYSPNSSTPKDTQAGGMNISSLMNVFAVMLAEGSGDPQVKQQVMENLARRRAAVEAEAANKQAFENEANQLAYRAKLNVAQEAESEQSVPSKEAGARKAQVEARVAEGTETGAVVATNEENRAKAATARTQSTPEYQQMLKDSAELDLEIKKIEKQLDEAKLRDANDPRLKELRTKLAEFEVQKAKYEALKAQGDAVKSRGGLGGIQAGLNVQQHLKQIQDAKFSGADDEAGKYPQALQQKVAYARDLADQAPIWLQNMRGVGKYAESAVNPITGMIDPSRGEIAYADMMRAVVPATQKISMGETLSQGEALILGGAIEDAWNQDPAFFDNIVDEIARSMQMIDPDTFGAFEEVVPGASVESDSLAPADELSPEQSQRQLARDAAIKMLAAYGITEAMMEQHKQSRLIYSQMQANLRAAEANAAQIEKRQARDRQHSAKEGIPGYQ